MDALCAKAAPETQIILVNDPDADRFALAERAGGKWRIFHGNEIGALLCEWALENTSGNDRHVLCSTVSSQILKKMAEKHGISFSETLTGFKWLATTAAQRPDLKAIFAFEEAIGYTCGTDRLLVGDKDGVSTVCVALELANALYARGQTLEGYLQEIFKKYGFHAWVNVGVAVASMRDVPGLFRPLVKDLEHRDYVKQIGRFRVNRVRDMRAPGCDTLLGTPNLPVGPTEMLTFYTDEVLCTFRPSGTEPKAKIYIEAVSPESQEKALAVAREFEQAFRALIGV